MNFSLPPDYVVTPAWVIDSAFKAKPPKRALLGSYNRLLSLSWNRKDKSTPVLREQECYEFLEMERRQFYQIVSEMEGMRWLRSERPRAGFVQFFFHGSDPTVSVENPTELEKNRTVLMRIEEDESIKLKDSESSSSSSEKPVRKTALISGPRKTIPDDGSPKTRLLIDNLHLVFEPETYSVLEWRPEFAAGIPERALGWIAKAYQDRERLVQGGGPIGLIVAHLLKQDAPHRYFLDNYVKILPESFLEAVGEIEFECMYCTERFGTRDLRSVHQRDAHPHPCDECHPVRFFASTEELKAHYQESHDLYRVRQPVETELIPAPELDGTAARTWQAVLHQLQDEMPKASFETWVRDTAPIRYDSNVLTIGTRNTYARDWLANRLTTRVNAILARLDETSETPIVVGFVVAHGEST